MIFGQVTDRVGGRIMLPCQGGVVRHLKRQCPCNLPFPRGRVTWQSEHVFSVADLTVWRRTVAVSTRGAWSSAHVVGSLGGNSRRAGARRSNPPGPLGVGGGGGRIRATWGWISVDRGSKATLPLTMPRRVFKSSAKDSARRPWGIDIQGGRPRLVRRGG